MDGEELRHPMAVTAFRVLLYLLVAVALTVVATTALGFLGVLAVVGGLLAVVGEGGLLAVGGVAVVGVATVAVVGAGMVVGARYLERRVVAADRRPDPLAAAKRRYVEDDIDEVELEARLERILGGTGGRGRSQRRSPTRARRPPAREGDRRYDGRSRERRRERVRRK